MHHFFTKNHDVFVIEIFKATNKPINQGDDTMKMDLNKYFAMYGHLLPLYYKRMMRATYDQMKKGAEIIVPDPAGNVIHIVKR